MDSDQDFQAEASKSRGGSDGTRVLSRVQAALTALILLTNTPHTLCLMIKNNMWGLSLQTAE